MAKWSKKPYRYTLIGLEYGSKPEPYRLVITEDTRNGRRWVSCNCPSFTRGRQNIGATTDDTI